MPIARIEAIPVRYPEPNNDGKIRSLTLVRIETDDGHVGWGEAIASPQSTSVATAYVIEHRLAPLLLGADPRDVVGLWQAMRDATYWDGNGGIVTFGISAVDMALWDLKGHLEGRSLSDMLGRAVATTGSVPAPARSSTPRIWTASVASSRASAARATRSSRVAGATTCPSPSVATRRVTWPSPGPSATRSGRTSR